MKRPSFHEIYMRLACDLSARSTCKRLHVGTVIASTDSRKILAVGYNGNASGLFNGCDTTIPGKCGCLHSEENAVINCDVPRYVEKVVFVTHIPCTMCAKRLINLGNVIEIFYLNTYRSVESLSMFQQTGIKITSFSEIPGPRFFSWDYVKGSMSDDKYTYDIQGQVTDAKDAQKRQDEDYGKYAAAQVISTSPDMGSPNMIPATAPGLVPPIVPGQKLTNEQTMLTQDTLLDPVSSAVQANAAAAKDAGIVNVSDADVDAEKKVVGVMGYSLSDGN